MEVFGYISGLLLAFCAFPQFIKILKDGHCRELSRSFLWMWFIGLIGTTIYTQLTVGLNGPLAVNFLINTVFAGVSLQYSYFPKDK